LARCQVWRAPGQLVANPASENGRKAVLRARLSVDLDKYSTLSLSARGSWSPHPSVSPVYPIERRARFGTTSVVWAAWRRNLASAIQLGRARTWLVPGFDGSSLSENKADSRRFFRGLARLYSVDFGGVVGHPSTTFYGLPAMRSVGMRRYKGGTGEVYAHRHCSRNLLRPTTLLTCKRPVVAEVTVTSAIRP